MSAHIDLEVWNISVQLTFQARYLNSLNLHNNKAKIMVNVLT